MAALLQPDHSSVGSRARAAIAPPRPCARPKRRASWRAIKDVATIEGIRDNQLVGYGLVVGLRGTGDSSQTVFPAQTLISALERMGVTVPQTGSNSASNMQVKNMAGVFVVATLPPFSRPGYKMDITVSSAGDARSLEGGILLMTPLYGPDGQIYAQAQGALVLGGYTRCRRAATRGRSTTPPRRAFLAARWSSGPFPSISSSCTRSAWS